MCGPRVAVYAGRGSSHSWTWLADLFDRIGLFDVRFLDSREFVRVLREDPSVAIVSGGDGFAMASALSERGFRELSSYISRGGRYVGICAGAYLPLPSSIEPFSHFNLSTTTIENIMHGRWPEKGVLPRIAVRYGECAIFHPVRGELVIGHDGCELAAPIYGGPVFSEPSKDQVLLRYIRFTEATKFQVDRQLAAKTLLRKPAVIKVRHGEGGLLLCGPHLEHPRYPDANDLFLGMIGLRARDGAPRADGKGEARALSRALADLRVAVLGLENRSFLVGKKVWDGSRYLELVSAIERRKQDIGQSLGEALATELSRVAASLRRVDTGEESELDDMTAALVEAARACVDAHFQALAMGR